MCVHHLSSVSVVLMSFTANLLDDAHNEIPNRLCAVKSSAAGAEGNLPQSFLDPKKEPFTDKDTHAHAELNAYINCSVVFNVGRIYT